MDNLKKIVEKSQKIKQPSEQEERLNKFLARAGVASRRAAEVFIAEQRVSVNGVTATTPGTKIYPNKDVVKLDGKIIKTEKQHITAALYKPAGVVSTTTDPQGRKTVISLLPHTLRALRLYPVGRLDLDSEGLILLTNDGDLALKLTHPRYEAEKEYHALVTPPLSDEALQTLQNGIFIEGDHPGKTLPATVKRLRGPKYIKPDDQHEWISVAIREGKKRQVRLMVAAAGSDVKKLIRVRIGKLRLESLSLKSGDVKSLSSNEIALTLIHEDEAQSKEKLKRK